MTIKKQNIDDEAAKKIDDIKQVIIVECGEDHVGLWLILSRVKKEFVRMGRDTVRATTMNIVREILRDDSIRAGQFVMHETETSKRYNFVEWGLSREETVARIERAWDELGKEPNIGDIVWFTSGVSIEVVRPKERE